MEQEKDQRFNNLLILPERFLKNAPARTNIVLRKSVILLIGALMLSGCRMGSQAHIYDRVFVDPSEEGWNLVRIDGTTNHSQDRVENMFMLRAAEETLKLGKKHFIYKSVNLKRRDHYQVTTYYGAEISRSAQGSSYHLEASFKPIPEDRVITSEAASSKVFDAQEVFDRFKFMKPQKP